MGRKKKHGFSALHFRRLIFFADHLSNCLLDDYYMDAYNFKGPPVVVSGSRISFSCFPYIYVELPIFEQWQYSHKHGLLLSRGDKCWIKAREDEEFIRVFFGLSHKQMLSIFVPYVSKEYKLHSRSEPREVAKAIYLMLGETFPVAQRTVLIEKAS